jgi:ABC-2 type transport system permease protein
VLDAFSGWAPQIVVDAIASFSFLSHFESLSKGVLDLRDLIFFGSLIAVALAANVLIVELRKAT